MWTHASPPQIPLNLQAESCSRLSGSALWNSTLTPDAGRRRDPTCLQVGSLAHWPTNLRCGSVCAWAFFRWPVKPSGHMFVLGSCWTSTHENNDRAHTGRLLLCNTVGHWLDLIYFQSDFVILSHVIIKSPSSWIIRHSLKLKVNQVNCLYSVDSTTTKKSSFLIAANNLNSNV